MPTQHPAAFAHEPRLPQSPCGVAGSSEALLHRAQDARHTLHYPRLAVRLQEVRTALKSAEPRLPCLRAGNRVHFLQVLT
jgi:hypothetical protein